jgi:hypothetical protein
MKEEDHDETADKEIWPREILIRPTTEKAIEILGKDYDRDRDPEGDDALNYTIGYEMTETVEIDSWKELLEKYPGHFPVDPDEEEEYRGYLESLD